MNRSGLILSALIATIGALKILFPAEVATMFALDTSVALFAVLTAVIAYGVWRGPLNFLSGSFILGTIGFASIAFGVGSIISPTLMGLRSSFIPIADIFLLVETGIILQMIGLERKQRPALSPLLVLSLVWQLLPGRAQRAEATASTSH